MKMIWLENQEECLREREKCICRGPSREKLSRLSKPWLWQLHGLRRPVHERQDQKALSPRWTALNRQQTFRFECDSTLVDWRYEQSHHKSCFGLHTFAKYGFYPSSFCKTFFLKIISPYEIIISLLPLKRFANLKRL